MIPMIIYLSYTKSHSIIYGHLYKPAWIYLNAAPKDFFVRLVKKRSEYFVYSRVFLDNMTKKDEASRHGPSI